MTDSHARQADYPVRFDWGPAGAAATGGPGGALVVVDVLSFTTAVTVAVERGMAVVPAELPPDPEPSLLANGTRDAPVPSPHPASPGTVVARHRTAVTPQHPWSLSPAALLRAPVVSRLLLASRNGAAVAVRADADPVIAGCLRNARAVGDFLDRWLARREGGHVSVIAAGERWPDGSLRPAVEDLLGAAAILAALPERWSRSPEAQVAARCATADPAAALQACVSGRELVLAGFGDDVAVAAQPDVSRTVPLLRAGAFVPGGDHPHRDVPRQAS